MYLWYDSYTPVNSHTARSGILRETDNSHITLNTVFLIIGPFIVLTISLLLCLTCELNFTIGLCIGTNTVYLWFVLSMVSGVH